MSIEDLIGAIDRGQYQPTPGTVGERLLETMGECACAGEKTLARFARAVYRRQGMWWLLVLHADPTTLDNGEAEYVAATWREWLAGHRPAARRRVYGTR